MRKIIIILMIANLLFCGCTAIADINKIINMNKHIESNLLDNTYRPSEEWNFSYGGKFEDWGSYGVISDDNGYVMVGVTYSFSSEEGDIWLLKIDNNGIEEWNRTFGNGNDERADWIGKTSDGGYIIAGRTDSWISGNADGWIIKTDINGIEQWNKSFGGKDTDVFYTVQQTSDNGYVMTGGTYSYGAGDNDVWVIKTDSEGNILWNATFGDSHSYEYGYQITQINDGGYIIIGSTCNVPEEYSRDALLLKIDCNGKLEWMNEYGGSVFDQGNRIIQTEDGGFLFLIMSQFGNPDNALDTDILMIKTDENGNTEWEKRYGDRYYDEGPLSIIPTDDGGYIVSGSKESFYSNSGGNCLIVKFDSLGIPEWSKTFGGEEFDCGRGVVINNENDFVIFGHTKSFGHGDRDAWIVKLNNFTNIRPNKPLITNGTVEGKIGKEFEYSSIGEDPENEMIYYLFDWGDGSNSGWIGPYESGEECTASHIWLEDNSYLIKVKIKDMYNGESEWSDFLEINIPKLRKNFEINNKSILLWIIIKSITERNIENFIFGSLEFNNKLVQL